MSLVTPGWRLLAVGVENDAVTLQGHELWKQKWLRHTDDFIIVAHPNYPSERHQMSVYQLEVAPTIIFAAGEFSISVWGFYVPSVEAT